MRKLKEAAEAYLGHKVNKAVITVPAYFNDAQRQATKDAGQIAGLEVARIINEPTAAALAYGLDKKKNEKIVVFDLGGGTFDVSVLRSGRRPCSASSAPTAIRTWAATTSTRSDQLRGRRVQEANNGIDLRKDTMALQRLQEACEKAKKELSSRRRPTSTCRSSRPTPVGPKHLQMTHHPGEVRATGRPPDRALPRAGAARR